MRKSFVFRSTAAEDAIRNGETNFTTVFTPSTGMWKWAHQPGICLSAEWAKGKDFVAWTETTFVTEGDRPVKKGVVVVRITKQELAELEGDDVIPAEFVVEPITPSLWDDKDKGEAKPGGAPASLGSRAKSDVESPTKLVWKLADEMVGADRKDVIAACVEAGVNKSTASTQYYRWQKARSA